MPDKHEVGGSSPLGPTKEFLLLKTTEKKQTSYYGGVAQLGEHLPCKQGVMGSNPIISTMGRKSRILLGLASHSGYDGQHLNAVRIQSFRRKLEGIRVSGIP